MSERTCPLGHTCDSCLWETEVTKENVQTMEVKTFRQCALVTIAEQSGEQARMTYSLGAAIESQRNETTNAAHLLAGAINANRLEHQQ